MTREETLELYAKGREAWNEWANGLLAERALMERLGSWQVDDDNQAANDETKGWQDRATAAFSSTENPTKFLETVNLAGLRFPGLVLFDRAIVQAPFAADNADFLGAVSFDSTSFLQQSSCYGAKFHGDADFSKVKFSSSADFTLCQFQSFCIFNETKFHNSTYFPMAFFEQLVDFRNASFEGEVTFEGCQFSSAAEFLNVSFIGFTDFRGSVFSSEATFGSARSVGPFSLAEVRFSEVPNFIQAHFDEAPRLDNVRVPLKSKMSQDTAACYRALRRLAIQGHDHSNELDFFAAEIMSQRGAIDQLWPEPLNWFKVHLIKQDTLARTCWRWSKRDVGEVAEKVRIWPGGGRYWLGLFYEWFSDFGRSALRPFLLWIGLVAVSASLFFWAYDWRQARLATAESIAVVTDCAHPIWTSLLVALNKGLVFSGFGNSEKLSHHYACLYGTYNIGDSAQTFIPNVVSAIGVGQQLLSAILIFLLLLAIRNRFRIK